MSKTQFVAIAVGFATGFLFKALEMVAGTSFNAVTTDYRNWIATALFTCISAGAAYVLARWTPEKPPV